MANYIRMKRVKLIDCNDKFLLFLTIQLQTEKYYLRALGDDPRKDIANIHEQFPDLAEDIQFPDFYPKERFFSSVFRICSPGMQLWTHYDVSWISLYFVWSFYVGFISL